jgi:hypothetical protein
LVWISRGFLPSGPTASTARLQQRAQAQCSDSRRVPFNRREPIFTYYVRAASSRPGIHGAPCARVLHPRPRFPKPLFKAAKPAKRDASKEGYQELLNNREGPNQCPERHAPFRGTEENGVAAGKRRRGRARTRTTRTYVEKMEASLPGGGKGVSS